MVTAVSKQMTVMKLNVERKKYCKRKAERGKKKRGSDFQDFF